jgi:hypothetical protein
MMNQHLKQLVEEQLAQYNSAILATCGAAGPESSIVALLVQNFCLYLLIPHGSDHLFHLEVQPEIVILSPTWKLNGRGVLLHDATIAVAQPWQAVVQVEPAQLHILSKDGHSSIETIDF